MTGVQTCALPIFEQGLSDRNDPLARLHALRKDILLRSYLFAYALLFGLRRHFDGHEQNFNLAALIF